MRARRLNASELDLYRRVGKRAGFVAFGVDGLRVRYRRQGNFTIAELTDEEGRTRGVGVAKRNPTDKENAQIGRDVALSFAFRSA